MKMIGKKYRIRYFLFITLFILSFQTIASLETRIDKDTMTMGDTFQLSIQVSDDVSAAIPDVTLLEKNFDILSSGKSTQVLMVQGRTLSQVIWTFVLSPKITGDYEIPSIKIGNEASNPMMIHVNKAAINTDANQQNAHVFMKAMILPTSPYVQSRGLYKLFIYYDRKIENPQLTEPQSDNATFIHLGEDKNYPKELEGKSYEVFEVSFAIFPQKEGDLRIMSPVFSGYITQNEFHYPESFKIKANDIQVPIQGVPSEAKGHWWLPARNVSLKAEWSAPVNRLKVGEPVTRTIFIKAQDVLSHQLPALMPESLADFTIYPDKPIIDTAMNGHTLYATRLEKAAFIPQKSGDYYFPAIKVYWWDIDKNTLKMSEIPAESVHVIAGSAAIKNDNTLTKTPLLLKKKSTELYPSRTSSLPIFLSLKTALKDPWFWGFIFIFMLSFIYIFYHFLFQKILRKKKTSKKEMPAIHAVKKSMLKAAKHNDIPAFKEAIITLSQLTWPNERFLSLHDVIEFIADDEARSALRLLNEALYKPTSERVDLNHLLKSIKKIFLIEKKEHKKQGRLPQFYEGM
jgi:hypothetical protein